MPSIVVRRLLSGVSARAARRWAAALVLFVCGVLSFVPAGCLPYSGDEAVLNLWDEGPITLDPAISGEMSSHLYVMHLFSGLVKLDSEMKVAPDIASSWDVTDGGTTYEFHLRTDVRFHSGKKVTAADLKYSWERACSPSTGSRTAETYLGDIVGARDVLEGRATDISGVTVVDDHTLRVRIDRPRSYFLDKLTYPTTCVVDRDNVDDGADWWRRPNGTGPFELVRWEQGSLLELQRNGQYYGTAPLVDSVQFHLLAGVPMSLYEQGEIDVVNVSTSYMDLVTDPANPVHSELISSPELSLYYIGFDVTKPPFDDVYVRRAFSHAVDRERIVNIIFKDGVETATGILPAGLPGFDSSLRAFEFDPVLARDLLAQSSYGSAEALPPIELTTSGYANDVDAYLAAAIWDWRENLGVEVAVRQLETEAFLYNLKDERDEMYAMGWIADYPSPHNFLGTLFSSSEANNISGYANPELDELLDLAAAEDDWERRMALYRQAEQLVIDDAPCVPLVFGANQVLVKPYVSGYQVGPLGVPNLSVVSVDRP
ncbi:MAG: peptide ABC transporter substrate-binding protein [Dehalococcoidia bacterium]|jgi:oligopeptide transport system substrate-binding protein|nr:peptide ABC transporter substrate-binding protein [Dehalococcoidia bacterium]